MNVFIINTIVFIKVACGAHLLKTSNSDKHHRLIQKAYRHINTESSSRKYSTFVTLIDKNFITPYYINTNDRTHHQVVNKNNENSNSYHVFNGINLNFEQLKLFLIGIIVFSIVLGVLIIWLLRKFSKCFLLNCCCERLCCPCCKTNIQTAPSDSALSGECGCAFRVRKNKNKQPNDKTNLSVLNESSQKLLHEPFVSSNLRPNLKRMVSVSLNDIDSKKNFLFKKMPFNKVKSALVLIAIKV